MAPYDNHNYILFNYIHLNPRKYLVIVYYHVVEKYLYNVGKGILCM